MSDWYRVAADGHITLTLHIQPGAKKTEFAGLHGDALKIRLAAPPVDGKANGGQPQERPDLAAQGGRD